MVSRLLAVVAAYAALTTSAHGGDRGTPAEAKAMLAKAAAHYKAVGRTAALADFTSLPQFPFELDLVQLSRKEMADYARRAKDIGVGYIGSCCGAIATHVREMARALGKAPAEARPWRVDYSKPMSAYEYYKHEGS